MRYCSEAVTVQIARLPALATAGLLFLFVTPSRAEAERAHPFLFITAADIERARDGIKHNAAFATLAKELTKRATTNRLEALPSLERQWWEAARQKPWSDTYPEIFHHTFIVPLKWASLAQDCARANLVAPFPPLAAKAKRTLLSLSDYTFEFDHYDVGMNYTIWAMAALDACDILYGEFTPAERARLDAFFERYLAALRKSDDYWIEHEPGGKLNNHYAWHKLGLCMVGVFYERPELVQRALRGPKGVEFMLANGFKDDGLWLEGSIPYQFAETAPLVIMARMLENAHSPDSLFRFSAPNGRTLKQSYDALVPLLFPDRTLPPIGDAYAHRPHISQHPDWETLFSQFHEPVYAWLLADRGTRSLDALFHGTPDLPAAPPPLQPGKLWPEMGYAALRSDETTNYWSGRGWSLFATYSGQPVHEHADKLSLMLFAGGHLWLPDCEARTSAEHAFSSLIQTTLNRETLCHNTLLVDGRTQRLPGQRLDLLEFTNGPGLKRLSIGDMQGRLYDGVRQLRTLLVCPDYVLDLFQVSAAGPHEFAWVTHVDGESVAASLRATNAMTLPASAPWRFLRDAKSAHATSPLWECFSHDRQTLRLDLFPSGPTEVIQCGFPSDDGPAPQTIPMRLFKRSGTNAWFLAVYRLVSTPAEPAEASIAPAGPKTLDVTLSLSGRVAHHTVPRL